VRGVERVRTYNAGSEVRGGRIRGKGCGIRVLAVEGRRDDGAHVARESRWKNVPKIVSVCMFILESGVYTEGKVQLKRIMRWNFGLLPCAFDNYPPSLVRIDAEVNHFYLQCCM
jgi:hypothetical protein